MALSRWVRGEKGDGVRRSAVGDSEGTAHIYRLTSESENSRSRQVYRYMGFTDISHDTHKRSHLSTISPSGQMWLFEISYHNIIFS